MNPFEQDLESSILLGGSPAMEPQRMVGGERTRAYRYGITLVCVGALFNWLGYTEQNSDPVRFIGYTCLASGALLLCMAICFWANSSQRSRPNQPATPDQPLDFSVVSIVDPVSDRRIRREKPPDYSTVADMTPPPCYDEAIKLSPVYLQTQASPSTLDPVTVDQRPPDPPPTSDSASSLSPSTPTVHQDAESSSDKIVSPPVETSTLSKVIRLSSRLIRRTLSNVDCGDQQAATSRGPEIPRSQSAQNVKDV